MVSASAGGAEGPGGVEACRCSTWWSKPGPASAPARSPSPP